MDYVVKEVHEDNGGGHWHCTLIANMFLCGDLRERNLTLCYVPGPVYKIFKFFFGDKRWGTGTSCSLCGAFVGVLLFPLALILTLLALVIISILTVLFMPIFVVFILPILIITKCRSSDGADVMKISENGNGLA